MNPKLGRRAGHSTIDEIEGIVSHQCVISDASVASASTQPPKPSRPRIGCLGSLLAIFGGVFYARLWSSSAEFRNLWDPILGLAVSLVTVLGTGLVFLVIVWFIGRRNFSATTQRSLLLAPWFLAAAFWIVVAVLDTTPRARFAAEVIRPVPGSVRDVQAAGFNAILATRWLFSFTIDPAQVGDIVSKHSLEPTNPDDFQAMIERDSFFKRISWAHHVHYGNNTRCYSRSESEIPSRWACLIMDPQTSRAWFLRGYQN